MSMGQEADSKRNASLDEKKQRAAGRHGRTGQNAPGRDAIAETGSRTIGGAFGNQGEANREETGASKRGGRKRAR